MNLILIPGLWLNADSWRRVVPRLEQGGHRTTPLTLPGMESRENERRAITLQDHVAAVVAAIDAASVFEGRVVLVAHSAGGGLAYAAADARPERVARVVYVGGFPTPDGTPLADGFAVENGEIALPEWSEFSPEDLVGLDDDLFAEFRARAVPSPGFFAGEPQRLTSEARYHVPATVIATEFTTETLREWIAQGEPPVSDLARIRDVTMVDLPTGHWPQFSRPEDLADAILDAIAHDDAASAQAWLRDRDVQPWRIEPPIVADEAATLLGFLERQRATFLWKCSGLDTAALRSRLHPSEMTLAGLIKHMAHTEDEWCYFWLSDGTPALPMPWASVDWDSDPAWDWRTALAESPEELYALWQAAVSRSRRVVAEALARGGMDQLSRRSTPDGDTPSLRYILTTLLEEYARHNGHVDLLREAIDGLTGQDPPERKSAGAAGRE